MNTSDNIKKIVGTQAAELVQQDMIIGIGTGSTAYWFIEALAQKVKQGLKCTGVPTSSQSKEMAEKNGISLTTLNEITMIDLTVDGADEIDPALTLIKGGGGALLQEKMVASASKREVIIVDHTKFVSQLGTFPLPVEVIPYGWKLVQQKIMHAYNTEVRLRMNEQKPFITDHGHYILDCFFGHIPAPVILSKALKNIPGIVEVGLFINMVDEAMIGMPDGSIKYIKAE